MIHVEIANRSGTPVDEASVVEACTSVLRAEGVADGDLGVVFEPPERIRELKRLHLGVDETTDVLSFPIDAREDLPPGLPRQLGDVVRHTLVQRIVEAYTRHAEQTGTQRRR